MRSILVSFFFATLAAATTSAAPAVFTSGPAQVALMELYTSEGCSSCPPAEAALAGLRNDPRLWKEVVPVAFHVTYFDSPRWKDRFATQVFTARQYAYASAWSADQVYTPCLVQNGLEWRNRDPSPAPRQPGPLTAEVLADDRVRVTFRPAEKSVARYDAYVTLLGSDIHMDVRGGENAGRKLAHEFVALGLRQTELRAAADGTLEATIEGLAATPKAATAPRRALAVWIAPHGQLAPIQATGGWLD